MPESTEPLHRRLARLRIEIERAERRWHERGDATAIERLAAAQQEAERLVNELARRDRLARGASSRD